MYKTRIFEENTSYYTHPENSKLASNLSIQEDCGRIAWTAYEFQVEAGLDSKTLSKQNNQSK